MVYLGENIVGLNVPTDVEVTPEVKPTYVRPTEWPDLEAVLAAHPASAKGYGYAYAMLVEGRNAPSTYHYISVPANSAGCRHYVTSWGLDEDAKSSTQKWILSDPSTYQEFEWIVVYTDSAQDITLWGPNYYPYSYRWLVWFYAPGAIIEKNTGNGFCGVKSMREFKASRVKANSTFFQFGNYDTCKIDVDEYVVAENSATRINGTAFPQLLDTVLDLDIELSNTVHDMHDWFNSQYSLVSIKNAFSVPSSVSAMNSMFNECFSLTGIDVSDFDMQNVVNCNSMFIRCVSLKSLDTSNWDMHSLKAASQMFQDCKSLVSLDTSSWHMPELSNASQMFYQCSMLKSIDLHNACMQNVTTFESMFNEDRNLEYIDCHDWIVSSSYRMNNMFSSNTCLKTANLSSWIFGSQLSTAQNMFIYCVQLESLDISNWNFKCTFAVDNMFRGCYRLKTIDVANWDMSQVKNMASMFNTCYSLTSIDVSNWDTSSVSSMQGMFQNCRSLRSIDVSGWDTSKVTIIESMFTGCWCLSSVIDMSSWDVSKVTNANSMFHSCYAIQSFIMPNMPRVFSSQFAYCFSCMLYDFRACTSVPALDNVNAFQSIDANAKIVVPDSLYSSWRTATNWSNSNIQPKIVSASDYENSI